MPLGRRNSPGRSPLPPTLRRRSPVSASTTTSAWLDLAVATSQVWPSSVGPVARESLPSPGLADETSRSDTRTGGGARVELAGRGADRGVAGHANRTRAATTTHRGGRENDGEEKRAL